MILRRLLNQVTTNKNSPISSIVVAKLDPLQMSIGPPDTFSDNIDSQSDRITNILSDNFGEVLAIKPDSSNKGRIGPIGEEDVASEWINHDRSRLL